jgi:hypothetical protein
VAVDQAARDEMLQADKEERFANNMVTEFRLLLQRAGRQASRNRPVQVSHWTARCTLRLARVEPALVCQRLMTGQCHLWSLCRS